MEPLAFRKARQHFDTAPHPHHVTFDDAKHLRRNLPWSQYIETRWGYADPATLEVEFGSWLVLISGYNLGPLFVAIEEKTLLRLQARPDLERKRENESDSFAVSIRFAKPVATAAQAAWKGKPPQLDLGLA